MSNKDHLFGLSGCSPSRAQKPKHMAFSVFYLVGGHANFVQRQALGKFNREDAAQKVAELQRMGYKAIASQGEGLKSFNEFTSSEEARQYFQAMP